MLLLIDIGNTNITIGVSKGAQLISNWRVSTYKFATSDELWMLLSNLFETHKLNIDQVHGAAMGSVVPRLTSMVNQLLKEKLGAPVINVSSSLDLGIEIECEYPDSSRLYGDGIRWWTILRKQGPLQRRRQATEVHRLY